MLFSDGEKNNLGLIEASLLGIPESGVFEPNGESDLRTVLYVPDLGFREALGLSVSTLCADKLDPVTTAELVNVFFDSDFPSFSEEISSYRYKEDIIIADLANKSEFGIYSAQSIFLANVLNLATESGNKILALAPGCDSNGNCHEGYVLSHSFKNFPNMELLLVYPKDCKYIGIDETKLASKGGNTRIVFSNLNSFENYEFVKKFCRSNKILDGKKIVWAGQSNPARILIRIAVHTAIFSVMRKGNWGDYFIGINAGDGLSFICALWAWKFGLPITAVLLPFCCRGILGLDSDAKVLVSRFDSILPGVLRSLVLVEAVEKSFSENIAAEFKNKTNLNLDLDTALCLGSAISLLRDGLSGHSNVIITRGRCFDNIKNFKNITERVLLDVQNQEASLITFLSSD